MGDKKKTHKYIDVGIEFRSLTVSDGETVMPNLFPLTPYHSITCTQTFTQTPIHIEPDNVVIKGLINRSHENDNTLRHLLELSHTDKYEVYISFKLTKKKNNKVKYLDTNIPFFDFNDEQIGMHWDELSIESVLRSYRNIEKLFKIKEKDKYNITISFKVSKR